MPVTLDTISIITALGIAQGLFLSVAIWGVNSERPMANRILSITVLFLTISISHGVLTYTNLYFYLPHMILTGLPLSFTFGPLCLLYFNYLTDGDYTLGKRDLLLFLPFIICVAVLMPFYVRGGNEKWEILKLFIDEGKLYPPSQVLGILSQIHMWVYLVVIWKKVRTHQEKIKDNYSTIEKINLSWIKYFVILYAVTFLLFVPSTILRLSGHLNLEFERIVPLLVALNIYYLGYKGFHQSTIAAMPPNKAVEKKYSTTYLSKEESDTYKNELMELMDNEKLFQDSGLTLNDLASELSINRNLLSRVINEEIGQNFYDFINSYRVKEVMNKLKDKEYNSVSLLDIAMEAGFNSKATFNAVFKKMTNQTPSEYRKSLYQQ